MNLNPNTVDQVEQYCLGTRLITTRGARYRYCRAGLDLKAGQPVYAHLGLEHNVYADVQGKGPKRLLLGHVPVDVAQHQCCWIEEE